MSTSGILSCSFPSISHAFAHTSARELENSVDNLVVFLGVLCLWSIFSVYHSLAT